MKFNNKIRSFLFFLSIVAFLSLPYPVFGTLSKGTGARPLALGSAYAGLSDDAAGLFINPAGLAGIKYLNLTSMYAKLSDNITFSSISGALPLAGGVAGVGYRNRTISNTQVSLEVVDYADQEFLLAFARKISKDLSLGGSLKLVSKGISKSVVSYEGINGSGAAFDLSLKYNTFYPGLEVGICLQNLGGKINYLDGAVEEIPANFILGASYKLRDNNDFLFNLDLSQSKEEPLLLHAGLEWRPLEFLALRLGADQSAKSKTESYTHLTGGLGLDLAGITLDYALYRQGDPSKAITHYFSVGYAGPKPAKPKVLVKEKPELLHFTDVPPGYWAKKPIEYLTTLGILSYYPDGTFKPERPITRAETVVLLVRAKDYPLPKEKKQVFTDVPLDFWASDYIQTAWEKKLTFGYPDGTFRPRNTTTRMEGAAFLARFEELPLKESLEKPFPDVSLKHWGIKEVLAAKEEGILEYLKNRPFAPSHGLTRAELAEVLFRTKFAKQKIKEAGLTD